MAKPWGEGDYYEECSGKWGRKNKEREKKSKVTQDENKSKEKEKYTRNTRKKRRESLTQMKKEE